GCRGVRPGGSPRGPDGALDRRGRLGRRRDRRVRGSTMSSAESSAESTARSETEAPERTHAWVRGATEAVLMVTDEPVTPVVLATALGVPEDRVRRTLTDLRSEYASSSRGFELREIAGGWRLYSAPEFADVVSQFVLEGQTARLTQAALETLAVIAYRQPVSRGQVSAVRG